MPTSATAHSITVSVAHTTDIVAHVPTAASCSPEHSNCPHDQPWCQRLGEHSFAARYPAQHSAHDTRRRRTHDPRFAPGGPRVSPALFPVAPSTAHPPPLARSPALAPALVRDSLPRAPSALPLAPAASSPLPTPLAPVLPLARSPALAPALVRDSLPHAPPALPVAPAASSPLPTPMASVLPPSAPAALPPQPARSPISALAVVCGSLPAPPVPLVAIALPARSSTSALAVVCDSLPASPVPLVALALPARSSTSAPAVVCSSLCAPPVPLVALPVALPAPPCRNSVVAPPSERNSRRPPLLPPAPPAPLAFVPPLVRGWVAVSLSNGHTLFRNTATSTWQWDVPYSDGAAVAAADDDDDNALHALWPSELCALCSDNGEPGGCVSCGKIERRNQGTSTCDCVGVHVSLGGASCTPRCSIYVPPGRTAYARRRHGQLRPARPRPQVPPAASGVQRGWEYSGHLNAATQTDETNQTVFSVATIFCLVASPALPLIRGASLRSSI